MSVRIDIRGLPELQAMLRDLTDTQIPKAIAVALNRTAWDVRQAQIAEVPQAFDAPTPFIAKGIFYTKATAARQYAVAGWETKRDPIITPHVEGGARSLKKSEIALRARGIMDGGLWMVPGPAAPKDRYGNLTRGFIQELFHRINDLATSGRSGTWFVGGKRLGASPGIWRKKGGTIEPLLFFVRQPQYQKRYDFSGIAERKAREVMAGHLSEAVRKALELARR
jgi:hypothetical protein